MTQKSLIQSAGDGTAIPANYIGEVLSVSVSTDSSVIPSSFGDGGVTDISGLTLTVPAGVWAIELSVPITWAGASGGSGFCAPGIWLRSGTSTVEGVTGFGLLGAPGNASAVSPNSGGGVTVSVVRSLSASTTYKGSRGVYSISGAPTLDRFNTLGATRAMTIVATRIA